MNIPTISPQQLAELCTNGKIELLDVRTPIEFQEFHIAEAQNVPLDQLDAAAVMRTKSSPNNQPLYIICRAGGRGRQACEKFIGAGYTNVVNVEGGTLAWAQSGLPVVRGAKVMSLERQVRIAAGSLVLVGVLLGWFVHPAFFGVSAFVGAGLLFAGVTDTCGMGLMLARMPWNRVKQEAAACRLNKEVRS